MPTATATPKRGARPTPRTIKAPGGIEVRPEMAQKALTDLRRDLETGGRRLAKDVKSTATKSRRDVERLGRSVRHRAKTK